MDTRKLRHFVALCEHGSFHKAAEACHISQSAFSRSIQALEGELNVPLYDRQEGCQGPTPYGAQLLEQARQVLFHSRELQRHVTLMRQGDLGEIALGASPTPAALFLKDCLVRVAREHPRLVLQVTLGDAADLLRDLRSQQLDIVVVDAHVLVDTEGLDIEWLAHLPVDFVCRAGHPLLQAPSRTLAEVCRYSVCCSPLSDVSARELIELFGPPGHPDRMLTMRSVSYDLLKDVVLETDAVMVTTLAVVGQELAEGRMQALGLMPRQVQGRYASITLKGRTPAPALELVREVARSRVRA
jgi:DNA-binding transcriptional LysR family regulator